MNNRQRQWSKNVAQFVTANEQSGLWPSVPSGSITLYGSCYALIDASFLGASI
jgi:hypothetical protein